MGSEWIEVVDNGSGIAPCNFESIGLKHYTSKLREFEDIHHLQTFGFRGEAMNALCEISGNLSITTKHLDESLGASLQFGKDGK